MVVNLSSVFHKHLSALTHIQYDFFREKRGGHGHRCYTEGLSHSEKNVVDTLARGLSYKAYFIFNNIILPLKNGASTQVDHIVVSRYGIFVIESKDYGGWIFAGAYDKVWTQMFRSKRNNKFTFQNPIRQNYSHIKALEERLSVSQECFSNLVVFSENSQFKTPRISNVLYLSEVVEHIKQYHAVRFQVDEMVDVLGKLFFLCQAVDISNEQHISNVEQMLKRRS